MDAEFARASGAAFGILAGSGAIGLAVRVGFSWGTIKRDVSQTKSVVERIEPAVADHARALQSINQTLHGPEGGNGLYGTVRRLDERFDEFERRLGQVDPSPRRRAADRP